MAKGSLLGVLGDINGGLYSAPTSPFCNMAIGLASSSNIFPSAPLDNPFESTPGYSTPTTALGAAFDSLKVDCKILCNLFFKIFHTLYQRSF